MTSTLKAAKSIRTVGITLIVFSALITLSNGMGAVVSAFLDFDKMVFEGEDSETTMAFIMGHYFQLCLFMVVIGIIYFFAGIFLLKYKLWAHRLIIAVSILQVVIVWIMMISMRSAVDRHFSVGIIMVWPVIVAIAWTIPFAILIWFLNRKSIIACFHRDRPR